MLVNSLGKNKLKVTLTAFEITNLFGSYENINYSNADTKNVLNILLQKAVEISNAQFENGALFVEVYPTALGGCSIYFTRVKPEQRPYKRLKKVNGNILYCALEFSNSRDLLSAAERLHKNHSEQILSSSLFKHSRYYCLLVTCEDVIKRQIKALNEFADKINFGLEYSAKAKEHSRLIIKDNAIEHLTLSPSS